MTNWTDVLDPILKGSYPESLLEEYVGIVGDDSSMLTIWPPSAPTATFSG